jgi:hypothetical protein
MADWNSSRRANNKPLTVDPSRIIHEVEYRDRRIALTDDPKLLGPAYPDKYGFTIERGFIVIDAFDEIVFPIGMHWFYTPDDAVAAIEMLDTILPGIKEDQAATTLLYEYGLMRQYRKEFWYTYGAVVDIQRALDKAKTFDENPAETISKRLHLLRQAVAQGRSIG